MGEFVRTIRGVESDDDRQLFEIEPSLGSAALGQVSRRVPVVILESQQEDNCDRQVDVISVGDHPLGIYPKLLIRAVEEQVGQVDYQPLEQ